MKRAIVNLVTNHEAYKIGQTRLVNSLSHHFTGDVHYFIGEHSVGAPPHLENPYAFKVYAIEKVREMGYDQVLWLDASIYAVKEVTPVFEWLTEKGIFLEEAGHWAGTWSPPYVLDYFSITREEAMRMPMFAAGYCGFDFRRSESIDFFSEWKEAMLNGMFKGGWDISRHDMTSGSIIANKNGLLPLYSPGGQFFAYIGEAYGHPKETVVFHLKGVA
jgi:hypothetical protein